MNYKAVVIGDVHIKDNKIWKDYAHPLFFKWLSQIKTDHYIFTGDFFDTTSPTWDTFQKAIDFLSMLPGKKHIIQGNHEISQIKGSILPSFEIKVPNLKVYLEPTHVDIEGLDFLMAPFLLGSRIKMVEYYDSLQDTCDVLVAHLSPVGFNFGQEETNFPLINVKWKCYGHIHNPKGDIVGVPIPTREGERGQKRIFAFDGNNRIEIPIPTFLEFIDIDYSEEPPKEEGKILNIKNAPSLQEALVKFSDCWIRNEGTTLLRTDSNIEVDSIEDLSLIMADPKSFLHYAKEEELSQEVIDRCLESFNN
jgi:calcineurin-like phosphoesterase family protein